MDTRELQKGFQRHKSNSTTGPTNNSRTDSKDCIVDSADNCRLGIGKTDRELGFSDSTLDDISDFTGLTVESTGCTDCTKPTGV